MFDSTFRLILTLMVISMVSALVLSACFTMTEPLIEANRIHRQEENIRAVLPMAHEFKERVENDLTFFEGFDKEGEPIGLAVNRMGPGFQGPISLVIGVETDSFTITGVRVQEMVETPGLGARITEEWFLQQFEGLGQDASFNELDSIAGATVSADAVAMIIESSLDTIVEVYEEGGE